MDLLGVDDEQAGAVLEIRFGRLTRAGRATLDAERSELRAALGP